MNHVVLLGDSIFDNAAYVRGGLDVVSHFRQTIPAGWKATLRAVDGSVVQGVTRQTRDLPQDTTHLIVSAGGNDALHRAEILSRKAGSTAEVLNSLADVAEDFQRSYHGMLSAVLRLRIPTAVCTVYYPRFPDPAVQRIAVTALTVFNDVIIREAVMAGIPLLDLRLICNLDEHYANSIEPSEKGGRKIASAVVRLVQEHRFDTGRTEIFL